MGTKTISIMDDVYDLLVSLKRSDESFSEEIRRVITKKNADMMSFAGAWKDMSDEEIADMKNLVEEMRAQSGQRMQEILKRMDDGNSS